MKFSKDLVEGAEIPCGCFCLSRDQVVDFARRWDPQPFHIDEAAVEQSLFERLSASGLHTAAAARKLVLATLCEEYALLGSPGIVSMRLTQPVYPGETIRVTHRIGRIQPLSSWPTVALVECTTQGYGSNDERFFQIKEVNWFAFRSISKTFDVRQLALDPRALTPLGVSSLNAEVALNQSQTLSDGRFFFEDCAVGNTFVSYDRPIEVVDLAIFQSSFDPCVRSCGLSRPMHNEWQPVCFAMRALHDAFWSRSAALAGSGIDRLRWMSPVRDGDRLSAEMKITSARRLRSKPSIGVISADCLCVNQRRELVTRFSISAFLATRDSDEQSGKFKRA